MWSKQISPDGKTYYFNHVTFESSWVMPEELAAFEGPRKEIVVECKLIPKTEWRICLTNLDHEFFYNQHSKAKSWDIPEEILEIVGELLQDAMSEDEDEGLNEEENEKEDSDSISADELVEKRDPPEESEVCQTKRAKYDVSETEIIENSNFSHEAALDDKVVQPKTKMMRILHIKRMY